MLDLPWSNHIFHPMECWEHRTFKYKLFASNEKVQKPIDFWPPQASCHWCRDPCLNWKKEQYWRATGQFPWQCRDIYFWSWGSWAFRCTEIEGNWAWTFHSFFLGFKIQSCQQFCSLGLRARFKIINYREKSWNLTIVKV